MNIYQTIDAAKTVFEIECPKNPSSPKSRARAFKQTAFSRICGWLG